MVVDESYECDGAVTSNTVVTDCSGESTLYGDVETVN
jgi:hypothetical protein